MPDCLFADCLKDEKLLKVFNRNACSMVVGAFNCRYVDQSCISDEVRLADIPGLPSSDRYAVYSCSEERVQCLSQDNVVALNLAELAFDILTVVPIRDDWAPIGLVNLYNPGGTVVEATADSVVLMGGGTFLAWCNEPPVSISINGAAVPFGYEAHSLRVTIDSQQNCELRIEKRGVGGS